MCGGGVGWYSCVTWSSEAGEGRILVENAIIGGGYFPPFSSSEKYTAFWIASHTSNIHFPVRLTMSTSTMAVNVGLGSVK